MTKKTAAVLIALLAGCVVFGCSGDKKEKRNEGLLTGTWVRPIRGQDDRLEGMRFDSDKRFGLVGIHTMHGLVWRVSKDTLIVATNTGRYPEKQESRLIVEKIDDQSLTLSGKNYLAGTYERNDGASGRVTGTVAYRQRIALPANAALHLTLKSEGGDFLGAQAIPAMGNQVPLSFQLCYLTAAVNPDHLYELEAMIVADGKPVFNTPQGIPVITQGHPTDVEIIVTPFPGAETESQQTTTEKPQTFWISGMFSYMADAGLFTECRTGERFPVAQKADNIALEQAYLSTRKEPAEPVFVTIEGHLALEPKMEGDGKQEALIVDRFLSISADVQCSDEFVVTVGNTHWELVAIAEEPVAAAGQKPAFFRLNLDNGRVLGFGGCNSFFGSVTSEGSTLTFSKMGATLMACQDGMETEKAFMSVLDSTTEYDLTGNTLILRSNDRDLATFRARYFK